MSQFLFRTIRSAPITTSTHSIQVESKQLFIPTPLGGLSYQTPTAVYSLDTGERMPIYDVTRMVIICLMVIGFLLTMLTKWRSK
ncbi:MAG: hypothetical protein AAF490_01670 [Chloroflexota bacterium]